MSQDHGDGWERFGSEVLPKLKVWQNFAMISLSRKYIILFVMHNFTTNGELDTFPIYFDCDIVFRNRLFNLYMSTRTSSQYSHRAIYSSCRRGSAFEGPSHRYSTHFGETRTQYFKVNMVSNKHFSDMNSQKWLVNGDVTQR